MIFTAKIQIKLDGDRLDDLRLDGYPDTAIIHRCCDELKDKEPPYLTVGILHFSDCAIVGEEEKEKLPF